MSPQLSLLLTSFLVLLQELILIRWLGGQVRVIAYFPNLVLLSAFLGLGLGCLSAKGEHPRRLWLWPLALLLIIGVAHWMSGVVFSNEDSSEHLWLLYGDLPRDAPVVKDVKLPIIAIFCLTAFAFWPLGEAVAVQLGRFQQQGKQLLGYCWDIGGSLLGILFFGVLSYLEVFPVVWFACLLGLGMLLFWPLRGHRWFYPVAAFAILFGVNASERASYYSPYYALSTRSGDSLNMSSDSLVVLTNGSIHQIAQTMIPTPEDTAGVTANQSNRRAYHQIYRNLDHPPKKVLIIGAGTGNDVSVALSEGAEQIDAVEIDPRIQRLGVQYHPDHPYSSPKVRVFRTDARSFLNECQEEYDLVVFGTLDSMTRLSALSNVRLDNFVYTEESLAAAKRRLKPDGGLVLMFYVGRNEIHLKLMAMMSHLFGDELAFLQVERAMFNLAYMGGKAFSHAHLQPGVLVRLPASEIHRLAAATELPSDDWPYLYLDSRSVSKFYLTLMLAFSVLAVISVAAVSKSMRASLLNPRTIDWEMLLFGAGFLLLETRGVTQMNLAWGATWLTSSVVFGLILFMLLISSILAYRFKISYRACMLGIIASLVLAYFVPTSDLVRSSIFLRLALSLVVLGLPVFFAGLCFGHRFALRAQPELAFGWNLLGAVIGGLLEFFSMVLGLRALLLVAILTYTSAYLLRSRD